MTTFLFQEFNDDQRELLLSEKNHHHLVRVLRAREGDLFYLSNGKGLIAKASLLKIHAKGSTASILEITLHQKKEPKIGLAMALLHNLDRMEEAIFHATSFGISHFYLFPTERSQRRELSSNQKTRIEEQLIAAGKVSCLAFLPTVEYLDFLEAALEKGGLSLICDAQSQKSLLSLDLSSQKKATLFIGPEGDWTSKERELFKKRGDHSYALLPNILRAESAALAAAAIALAFK